MSEPLLFPVRLQAWEWQLVLLSLQRQAAREAEVSLDLGLDNATGRAISRIHDEVKAQLPATPPTPRTHRVTG